MQENLLVGENLIRFFYCLDNESGLDGNLLVTNYQVKFIPKQQSEKVQEYDKYEIALGYLRKLRFIQDKKFSIIEIYTKDGRSFKFKIDSLQMFWNAREVL